MLAAQAWPSVSAEPAAGNSGDDAGCAHPYCVEVRRRSMRAPAAPDVPLPISHRSHEIVRRSAHPVRPRHFAIRCPTETAFPCSPFSIPSPLSMCATSRQSQPPSLRFLRVASHRRGRTTVVPVGRRRPPGPVAVVARVDRWQATTRGARARSLRYSCWSGSPRGRAHPPAASPPPLPPLIRTRASRPCWRVGDGRRERGGCVPRYREDRQGQQRDQATESSGRDCEARRLDSEVTTSQPAVNEKAAAAMKSGKLPRT